MADTYVIYYPPTTGHPYLVVAFLADRVLQVTPFDSEEEAEAFIERDAPQLPWGRFICPGCGQTLDMHVSHGPGTPGTERFKEGA